MTVSIACRNGGTMHAHDSVQAVRACQSGTVETVLNDRYPSNSYGATSARNVVQPPPSVTVAPRNVDAEPTVRQCEYAKHLGADARVLPILTRAQMSSYIGILKGGTVPAQPPVETPAPKPVYYTPPPKAQLSPGVEAMIRQLPSGYYAWQPDDTTPLTFVRVRTQKTGPLSGSVLIHTQHGPTFLREIILYPSGQHTILHQSHQEMLENVLLGIVVDKFNSARRYAQEKGRCCRCHLELTDPRSRWFGIGPVCEPKWAWYVEGVELEKGMTFEEADRAGLVS